VPQELLTYVAAQLRSWDRSLFVCQESSTESPSNSFDIHILFQASQMVLRNVDTSSVQQTPEWMHMLDKCAAFGVPALLASYWCHQNEQPQGQGEEIKFVDFLKKWFASASECGGDRNALSECYRHLGITQLQRVAKHFNASGNLLDTNRLVSQCRLTALCRGDYSSALALAIPADPELEPSESMYELAACGLRNLCDSYWWAVAHGAHALVLRTLVSLWKELMEPVFASPHPNAFAMIAAIDAIEHRSSPLDPVFSRSEVERLISLVSDSVPADAAHSPQHVLAEDPFVQKARDLLHAWPRC
jgi:hypothetical protein